MKVFVLVFKLLEEFKLQYGNSILYVRSTSQELSVKKLSRIILKYSNTCNVRTLICMEETTKMRVMMKTTLLFIKKCTFVPFISIHGKLGLRRTTFSDLSNQLSCLIHIPIMQCGCCLCPACLLYSEQILNIKVIFKLTKSQESRHFIRVSWQRLFQIDTQHCGVCMIA